MAAGSHATFGGWEPRTCCLCGERVVLSHIGALRFHFDDVAGVGRSWHVACEQNSHVVALEVDDAAGHDQDAKQVLRASGRRPAASRAS